MFMKKLYMLAGVMALCAVASMTAMEPDRSTIDRQLNAIFNANTSNYDWKAVFNILSSTEDSSIVNSYRDRHGRTLLCIAASTRNAPFIIMRLINDFGADPNMPDEGRVYPLSYSMQLNGQDIPEAIYTLVKLGADPYFKNNGGRDGRGNDIRDYATMFRDSKSILNAIDRGLADRNEEQEAEEDSE